MYDIVIGAPIDGFVGVNEIARPIPTPPKKSSWEEGNSWVVATSNSRSRHWMPGEIQCMLCCLHFIPRAQYFFVFFVDISVKIIPETTLLLYSTPISYFLFLVYSVVWRAMFTCLKYTDAQGFLCIVCCVFRRALRTTPNPKRPIYEKRKSWKLCAIYPHTRYSACM